MSMSQLEQALHLIHVNEDHGYVLGRREEALIEAAEKALGLSLPPTYRRFVAELGCAGISGAEFYGLTNDNFVTASVPNGIWLTLKLRKANVLPKSLIVVSDTGDGGYYAIDTSFRDTQDENPIVLWYPGLSKPEISPEKVADDFGTFILRQVTEALQ
jgi:hypothetical protein